MILTCPACSSRYLVDPRSLGAMGRKVRCARCAHVWYEKAPETPAPPAALPVARELSEDRHIQLPAVMPPKRSWARGLAWSAATLILFAGLIVAAIAERGWVAGQWPAVGPLYAALGLPIPSAELGLELRGVTPSRTTENNLPTLVIQGEVVNVTRDARPVPKLKVILRDGSDRELQSWTFAVTDEPLLPGASLPFRTSVAEPSEAATGVAVTFAEGTD